MPSKCLGKTILFHSLPNFPENHKVLFFWFFPSERRPHPRLVVTGGKASAELSGRVDFWPSACAQEQQTGSAETVRRQHAPKNNFLHTLESESQF